MTVYVQLSDSTKTKIIAVFGSPQVPENYSNYAEIEESDTTLYPVYESFMTSAKNPFLVS
ncbi:TPA: hypothetical protein ACRPAJ_000537 [Escherichia coli]